MRRDLNERGRVTLYHGWESGMDNSPRWDAAYANVVPGDVPEYQREDKGCYYHKGYDATICRCKKSFFGEDCSGQCAGEWKGA